MEPLRVTMTMGTPLLFPARKKPYPLRLDSIIVGLMTDLNGEIDCPTDTSNSPYLPEINTAGVPLAVLGKNKKFYAASVMEIPRSSEIYSYTMTKKTECWLQMFNEYASWNKSVIPLNLGPYKACMEKYVGIAMSKINFYCLGDKEKLFDLLSELKGTGLGVRRSVGFGSVLNVTIASIDQDFSVFDEKSRPARYIPTEEALGKPGWLKDYCTYKPPYWNEENKTMCWVPPLARWMPM